MAADTPGGFGSAEALLGEVFAEAPGLRGRHGARDQGRDHPGVPYDSSPPISRRRSTISLRRLRTDHVELWQVHRPDLLTHPQEIARGLEEAHRAGKIGAIGVSNFTAAQTAALAKFLPVPVASHQSEFSPLHLAPLFDGIFDQSMAEGMASSPGRRSAAAGSAIRPTSAHGPSPGCSMRRPRTMASRALRRPTAG
jgi:predicted oxidoreductase